MDVAPPTAALRQRLVEVLERSGYLKSPTVRYAFLDVPREQFVQEFAAKHGLDAVYRDEVIVLKRDATGGVISTSSQPAVMASMLENLHLHAGQRVLEIGTGSGYNAALLASIVGPSGHVTSVDIEPELVATAQSMLESAGYPVTVAEGDGRRGWSAGGPYDRIILTASSADIPYSWYEQLAPGGLLELPLQVRESVLEAQVIVVLRKSDEGLESVRVSPGQFMGMRGGATDRASLSPGVLRASQTVRGRMQLLAVIAGEAVRELGQEERRNLLSVFLMPPRRRPLGMRASRLGLYLFTVIAAAKEHVVQCARGADQSVGIIGTKGNDIAVLAGGDRTYTMLHLYGAGDGEVALREIVDRWGGLGRPSADRLRVRVRFPRRRTRISLEWT